MKHWTENMLNLNIMSDYTPGKWEVIKDSEHPLHGIWSDDEVPTYIARTCFAPNSEANAKLIAAAPELLEALQEIIAITDRNHIAWDKAKAAIKKAMSA
jgi:hypothetical protein